MGRLRDLYRRWHAKREQRRMAQQEALKSLHDEPSSHRPTDYYD